MTEHELPDDVNRWPTDASAILGIPDDATVREVKRAYTQLIRRYRPDERPAEFQRIREAYESAELFAQFRARCPEAFRDEELNEAGHGDGAGRESPDPASGLTEGLPNDDTTSKDKETATSSDRESEDKKGDLRSSEAAGSGDPRRALLSSANREASPDAWDLAIGGDYSSAMRRLQQLAIEHTDPETVTVCRFWLAKLHPSGTGVDPVDILFAEVERAGGSWRICSLLIEELLGDSGHMLGPRVTQLIQSVVSPEQLTSLVAARWRVAGRDGRWEIIDLDLAALRRGFLPDNAFGWLDCLVDYMRVCAFRVSNVEASQEVWLKNWFTEMAHLNDLQLQFGYQFDEAEHWYELSQELALLLSDRSASIKEVLRSSVFENAFVNHQRKVLLANDWREHPLVALEALDELARSRPHCLMQLAIESRNHNDEDLDDEDCELDPDTQRKLVRSLISKLVSHPPSAARELVIAFCQCEVIPIDTLLTMSLEVVAPRWKSTIDILVERLSHDVSLKCLCGWLSRIAKARSLD